MTDLFDALTIQGVTLRNRIGVAPMCQYSYEDGLSNEWQVLHLGTRAIGGAGLVLTEATAVEADGRITPNDVGIWSDAHIEPLARVTNIIKLHGAVPGIQLAHSGRKGSTHRPWDGGGPISLDDPRGWQVIAPSPIPYDKEYPLPHELDLAGIREIQMAFRSAAERSLNAGFSWLEIHAAHGYLIHSFYSPLSNQRTDEYGGSFENRIRFLVETTRLVRSVWPQKLPLAVRISGTDWIDGGWTVGESVELARILKKESVDLIDCSSAGLIPRANVPISPGYQVPISEAVRREANILTAAVGIIKTPEQANEIIRNGQADLVLLGREMLRDPYWALHAAQVLKKFAPIPPQYLQAF
jgi:2,4-dienoyl-CoA reductase-like NADH-dependent reductase (Old Yellow Enzyme family)